MESCPSNVNRQGITSEKILMPSKLRGGTIWRLLATTLGNFYLTSSCLIKRLDSPVSVIFGAQAGKATNLIFLKRAKWNEWHSTEKSSRFMGAGGDVGKVT